MSGQELKLIQHAFDTNWVAPAGPFIDEFEASLASYNQVPHCAALSSGTAAIHLALILLNVQQGDEVICSSFTFSGSCNPILYQKAIPIFVDSENETWNMDPVILNDAIADRIKKGKKPKAIIAVHLYGMPAKMDKIMEVAQNYGIPVIEDAAEGLGASYNNQKLGTFGDIGIFSFNGNKIITTSGGGAMVSRNAEWIKNAKFLSTQARDPAPHYEHSKVGYNYRLSNICAAIGVGQMKVLDERVSQRRKVYEIYKTLFATVPDVSFQPELKQSYSNRWLSCMLLGSDRREEPEDIRIALEKHNIESRPLWKPMHLQPVFRNFPYYGSRTSDLLFKRGLCLPSGSSLTTQEIEKICTLVQEKLT